ncbi:hypothetical protein HXP44_17240 [Streptomyces sioyaensis]|uniref:Uncharacterized protein n=1 Tax=Streptomyces sioyaensis TaxID=67364 RepID=A0A4Q1RBL3_9ACTN|nr:hypothetical protein [Streptomyces sioyaensis]MBM4793764.1 hypothetical protein [Streptomyces sioyaensis]RXS70906.1 hypothetical protein EST54_01915 [Streptomyces sioyaensis]
MPMLGKERARPASGDAAGRAVEFALAAWLLVTVVSHHPHQIFDRLRPYDKAGLLIPNWRFFAPFPAQHDFHVLYRTLSVSDQESPWQAASRINRRKWSQVFWFPGRRQEKAVFDICHELVGTAPENIQMSTTPAARLLSDFVLRHIKEHDAEWPGITGFQFLVARYSGHDDSEDPQYDFVSPFVPLTEADRHEGGTKGHAGRPYDRTERREGAA